MVSVFIVWDNDNTIRIIGPAPEDMRKLKQLMTADTVEVPYMKSICPEYFKPENKGKKLSVASVSLLARTFSEPEAVVSKLSMHTLPEIPDTFPPEDDIIIPLEEEEKSEVIYIP